MSRAEHWFPAFFGLATLIIVTGMVLSVATSDITFFVLGGWVGVVILVTLILWVQRSLKRE